MQRDRTWCQTGTTYRIRKDGVYRVHDPQTHKKNRQGKGCVEKSGKIEGKRKKCDREKERSDEALSKLSTGDAALVSVS